MQQANILNLVIVVLDRLQAFWHRSRQINGLVMEIRLVPLSLL